MNPVENDRVRLENTWRRENGNGGYYSGIYMSPERARAIALSIDSEISNNMLKNSYSVLRTSAFDRLQDIDYYEYQDDNGIIDDIEGLDALRNLNLANSVGLELLHRNQSGILDTTPAFSHVLFDDLALTAEIAERFGLHADALRSRLHASTLALQLSCYEPLITTGDRRELALESLGFIKDAMSISLEFIDHANDLETENLKGALAESIILGSFMLSQRNEQGIIAAPANMRQDEGYIDKNNAEHSNNPRFDIAILKANGLVTMPTLESKIQVKFRNSQYSTKTYAPDITVLFMEELLRKSMAYCDREVNTWDGIRQLVQEDEIKLWKRLNKEIEYGMKKDLFKSR